MSFGTGFYFLIIPILAILMLAGGLLFTFFQFARPAPAKVRRGLSVKYKRNVDI